MVNVAVAVYVPVLYTGSLVSVQDTEPESPAFAECASAPNVATEVVADVLAVCAELHAVPEATVQV